MCLLSRQHLGCRGYVHQSSVREACAAGPAPTAFTARSSQATTLPGGAAGAGSSWLSATLATEAQVPPQRASYHYFCCH